MQILHNSGPSLLVGIPTLGRPVPLDWALSFKSQAPPINYNTVFHIISGRAIDYARNEMVKVALDKGCKYIFFLGDDVVPPNHALRQLIYRLDNDIDKSIGAVGGVYCTKSDPSNPLVFRGNGAGSYWDWKIGEFFEVTGLGMDCTLIRTDVFKEMKEPYFKTVSEDNFLDGINQAEEWTEDLYFFKKLQEETKYKIFCDAFVICDHWDIGAGRKYGLPADSLPMRQKLVVKDKKALVLGGPITLVDAAAFDITTFGVNGDSDYRGEPHSLPFGPAEFDWVVAADQDVVDRSVVVELCRVAKSKVTISYKEYIDFNLLSKYYSEIIQGVAVIPESRSIEITKTVENS